MNNRFPNFRLQPKKVSFLYPLNLPAGITLYWLPTAFCLFNFSLLIPEVQAQIVPDSTLPVNSIVTPANNRDIIEGGTQAGGNLFHSFQQFSVPTGREAFFNNGLDIQNIFTRVTGNSISNIDGLISANGTANLFLLNPNGIIFGPNAKLNIGGSFLASTANSFKFSDGTEFNAKNPQTSPVLTVNVPVGLQYGGNAGNIRIQGKGQESGLGGETINFPKDLNPLEVNAGNTLAFVGGNIIIDGGILQAPGGRVELGGLAGEGIVGINIDNNNITSFSFPDGVEKADISVNNKGGINVLDAGGGSITVNARNLNILGNSLLTTGIASDLGSVDVKAGDINLNATGIIRIASSRIENNVNPSANGNSGNIKIASGSVYLTDESRISTATFADGNAGNLELAAISLISLDNNVKLESNIGATGKSGNISVKSGDRIEIKNSAITSSTKLKGLAGEISLEAENLINIANSELNANSSQGLTLEDLINPDSSEIPNSIILKAGSIDIKESNLSTVLSGTEFAGYVYIAADDNVAIANSKISSDANQTGGTAGDIFIYAGKLTNILNSYITAEGFAGLSPDKVDNLNINTANGNENTTDENTPAGGGNIAINSGNLNLDGTTLSTAISSSGVAGYVRIIADDNLAISNNSYISSDAKQAGGQAGTIEIKSGKVVDIRDTTLTATSDRGLTANDISIDSEIDSGASNGNSASENNPSFGGYITIASKTVKLSNANLSTKLVGSGFAGSVQILADENITIANKSQISSDASQDGGTAGFIYINSGKLVDIQDSQITATSDRGTLILNNFADGTDQVNNSGNSASEDSNQPSPGGSISIEAGTINLNNTTLNTSLYGSGYAGSIGLFANDRVVIENGSQIFSDAFNNDDPNSPTGGIAGYVYINAPNSIEITTNSNISAESYGFTEGNTNNSVGEISIQARTVAISGSATLSTNTFGSATAGNIKIAANDNISISGNSTIASTVGSTEFTEASGNGGTIEIASNSFSLTDGSQLDAASFGQGNAGNISFNVAGVVDIAGENTAIFSDATPDAEGDAGSIDIQAAEVFIRDGANLITDNNGKKGKAGTITIATATTSLNNNSFISSESSSGNGGNIYLKSENLLVLRGKSNISTSAGTVNDGGKGGNITINTNNLVALENSNIIANAFAGQGGQIIIDTKGIFGAKTSTREELENLAPGTDINYAVIKLISSSDITAISQSGDPQLQGTVTISTPDVDPSAGLIELPATVVDATKLAASSCRRSDEEQKNQFIVTGRGGLPPNPNEALNDEATWMDLRARGGERQIRSTVPNSQSSTTNPQIREAQGWKVNSQGQVELLAESLTVTPQNSGIKPLQCLAP